MKVMRPEYDLRLGSGLLQEPGHIFKQDNAEPRTYTVAGSALSAEPLERIAPAAIPDPSFAVEQVPFARVNGVIPSGVVK